MRLPKIHRYGQVFNFVADNIHCWADAEGAQVWDVKFRNNDNPHIGCRVLAFMEGDAVQLSRDWEDEWFPEYEGDPEDHEEED